MLSRVEAVIRAFDPCLSCSTHASGRLMLGVELRSKGWRAARLAAVLIIGYGNPLRGDDGFGYRAAERLPGAIAVHQLTPELMDPISRAGRVIFLDASAEGVPGEIRRRTVSPAPAAWHFTHHATPEALLAGSLQLYGRAPEATLITVTGAEFGLSETLSPKVQSALEEVLAEVLRVSASPRQEHSL